MSKTVGQCNSEGSWGRCEKLDGHVGFHQNGSFTWILPTKLDRIKEANLRHTKNTIKTWTLPPRQDG